MDWEYLRTLGVIGGLALILQMGIAFWDNWVNGAWHGLGRRITLWEILAEWAVYMLIFLALSLLLQGALKLACLSC